MQSDYILEAYKREAGAMASRVGLPPSDELTGEHNDHNDAFRHAYDPRRTYQQHGDWERTVEESGEALQRDQKVTLKQKANEFGKDSDEVLDEGKVPGHVELEDVFVHGYSRRTGEVKSHHRGPPDGDMGNNRS